MVQTGSASASSMGLGSAPSSVRKYDWRKDIPADALDAKNFSSIDSWLDACIAQNRPGKIGSGTYEVDGEARYAPKGIYGYGDTPPKFVAENVDCWLYLKNQDVTLKGLQFEGFGQVLAGAVPLSEGSPYHSTTKYGFDRFLPPEDGGTALKLQVAASDKTVGPDVIISDSVFIDCENVFTFVSDTTKMGRIDFDNNSLTGTYGMLDIDSVFWTEVNANGNEWADATGDRAQPNVKQNGVQTGFKIGTNSSAEQAGHHTKLSIVNNHAHDIQSVGTYDDTNAAVFVDARGVNSLNRGDNVISFNHIERLQGLKGQEDSNAIYAKAWGLIVQGNVIEKSGAAYLDAKHNGSETSGVLIKPLSLGLARDIEVVGNTFIGMPTAPKGVAPDLSVVKVSEAVGNSSISFNTFIGGGNLSGSPASGLIRWYGDYENLKVVGNSFKDVAIGPGDNAVVFHQLKGHGAETVEVSNNSASKTFGDYAGDTRLVLFNGDRPAVLITGYNVLDGGHALDLSLNGNKAAQPQVYKPPATPTIPTTPPPPPPPPPGGSGPQIIVNPLGVLTENTRTETRVADILASTAGVAVSVNDARFMVKDSGIYLRAGQSIDFEAGSMIPLKLTAATASGSTTKSVYVSLRDLNEAPTAVSVTNVKALAEHTTARTFLADVAVADPDKYFAFRNNVVGVDDSRFEVSGGHLYLKAGQSVDGGASGTIPLLLTVQGTSVRTSIDLVVGKKTSGGSPTPVESTPWRESADPVRTISGTSGKDILYGSAAAELLDGRDREDIMAGGAGDDTYVASGYRDIVLESRNGGVDTVLVKDSRFFLPSNVENLIATTSDILMVGNGLANILTGSAGSDVLLGGAGNDLLQLGGGADLVIVGPDEGFDVVDGFSADDRLFIAGGPFSSLAEMKAAFHQVGSDAVLDLSDGAGVILKNVAVADLGARQLGFDGLTATAALGASPVATRGGTSLAELVSGTASHDLVIGRGGIDVMAGGRGDDSYVVETVGDRVLEQTGAGIDQVLLRMSAYAMDANVENVRVEYAPGASVEGNASANWIFGANGADTLNGGGGRDRISGGGGGDRIDGGAGSDYLTGGEGNDTFIFVHEADMGDTISDFQPGIDRIDVSALVDETGGTVSTAKLAGGLAIILNHDGVADLVAVLSGIGELKPVDLHV